LYRIAHNLMANWHRDRQRHQVVALEDAALNLEQAEEPQQMAELEEEKDRLLVTIRCLPPERQQLLILKFAEGLSNAEIGRIMGRSEGAIKSLYYRTLVSLREMLQDPVGFERN
jgi:RNA polymerase sigma-70 factor (ECF subfamily)